MAERPACLACGSRESEPWATARDAEYLTSDDTFAYQRCRACHALFIDPVPDDRLGEIYPANYYAYAAEDRSLVFRLKEVLDARRFARVLRRLPGEQLNVLDVGGGDGWQLGVIRGLDPRVAQTEVVDIDPAAAELARRNGHRYTLGRIEEFESELRFGLVLLLNLIEHVRDPLGVLRRVREHLCPDGVVLVQTPNVDSPDARLFRHRNWGGYHCPRHWVLFDRQSFTALAGRAGLEVRRFAYTQGAAFWALSVLIALAGRGLIRVTRERPAGNHPLFPILAATFASLDVASAALGGRPSQMVFELGRSG